MSVALDKDGRPLDAARPLPVIDRPLSERFWEATRNHRLEILRCKDCRRWIWYPQTLCYECNSSDLAYEPIGGTGTVYSFVVIQQGLHPYFATRLPLAVALVALDDAPYVRLTANILECPPEQVHVGMAVEVMFEDVTEDITLAQFRPAGASGGNDAGDHTS